MRFDTTLLLVSAAFSLLMVLSEPDAGLRALIVSMFGTHVCLFLLVVIPFHKDAYQEELDQFIESGELNS